MSAWTFYSVLVCWEFFCFLEFTWLYFFEALYRRHPDLKFIEVFFAFFKNLT